MMWQAQEPLQRTTLLHLHADLNGCRQCHFCRANRINSIGVSETLMQTVWVQQELTTVKGPQVSPSKGGRQACKEQNLDIYETL
jgi:hypothetical protein